MAYTEVQALLKAASDLYMEGELLAAMAEWEHALELDPQCTVALMAISSLHANYDLLHEALLPDGQRMQPTDLDYRNYADPGPLDPIHEDSAVDATDRQRQRPLLVPLSDDAQARATMDLWTRDDHTTEVPADARDDIAHRLLHEVERSSPPSESPTEQTRRRVQGFIALAQNAHQAGDLTRAVIALELAFDENPDSAVVHKLLTLHGERIEQIFAEYLGSHDLRPQMGVSIADLRSHDLDARAAFLLSRIDGTLTVEELLDIAGMPHLEALRYLSFLTLRGILILSP